MHRVCSYGVENKLFFSTLIILIGRVNLMFGVVEYHPNKSDYDYNIISVKNFCVEYKFSLQLREIIRVWFLFPPCLVFLKQFFIGVAVLFFLIHFFPLNLRVCFSELNTQVWKCHKFFLLQIFQIRATITFNDNVQLHTDHLQADFKSVGRID